MLTFEDVTGCFLKAANSAALMTHPEYWINSRSLEREFASTCHAGSCEEAEHRSTCTFSFTWGALDTSLSLDGPAGVCDFFHEPGDDCPHLHTRDIPPLVVDLSYSLALNGAGASLSDTVLLSLIQMLKFRASEHSSRAIETRPGIAMTLHENRLQPEVLTLQQRVELPIWHPDGMHGLHDDHHAHAERGNRRRRREMDEDNEEDEVVADNPRPEDWLPQIMVDVCQDILQVLEALDAVRAHGSLNLDA
ncbi:MAG TPA: hypothetical protein VKP04_08625 [Ktedonobacteraceae bacterium]|jgi:hypothetical protein|nr:hypothetical protein [Ktedonobacteraceae bacterium]